MKFESGCDLVEQLAVKLEDFGLTLPVASFSQISVSLKPVVRSF